MIGKVEDGEISGFISDVVISEVSYGYVRAVTGLKAYELKRKVGKLGLTLLLL
ncbi:PIN domain-containing protein [Geoglobus ahangari]|uniref:hypothetical protein n=1 Tax=Geoglobus ahangari TaxID=113653 RepID=UPI00146FCE67|nr:hypothetical protein [Geoglobus ahangari]